VRLISARITGYGRLADVKVNLDSKVIAVVGPNEAGKTTFLKALAYLSNGASLSVIERSRGVTVTDDTCVVEVKFALDDDDRSGLAALGLEALPLTMYASREAAGGDVLTQTEPWPRKAVRPLSKALTALEGSLQRKTLQSLVLAESAFGNPNAEDARDFRAELQHMVVTLRSIVDDESGPDEAQLAVQSGDLVAALIPDKKADGLRDALTSAKLWLEESDPASTVFSSLRQRAPDFLLFGEDDRSLRSSYALDDALLGAVPAALRNLTRMAEFDLHTMVTAHRSGDVARRDSAIVQANNRLRSRFRDTWKQATLSVRLSVDGDQLRVSIIENDEDVTIFDERSAGLRMFVALVAFLSTRDTTTPPILLIDEAESHLHIDAQADLVSMFVSQDQAARVVYSTHSPACLPPDLGVGIRSVVPSSTNGQISDMKNSFWSDGAGYSPLMIAMGAAAAAFTPARCVVLAEGATEMILLPSLIRSSTGLEVLPYQVAPGLSEVPRDFYTSLDLQGAKVAYLLDGDAQGKRLRKELLEHGVPESRIVISPVHGVENLLSANDYREVVLALLAECNPGAEIPALPSFGAPMGASWATKLNKWTREYELRAPSKVAVANRIVEDQRARVAVDLSGPLSALHNELLKALEV
jgi:energy-coupling factor transporter ATP-binding protein EcfA2